MAVHTGLSAIAIVGIILLIGIVKKNGIMLVDFAQHLERNKALPADHRSHERHRSGALPAKSPSFNEFAFRTNGRVPRCASG
jgi:hypothetical protein